MRRFERRGTEAPMDFKYEREDRDLGPGWTPFRDVINRQRPAFSSQPQLQQQKPSFPTPQHQPLGFGPSINTTTSFQSNYPSSSGWNAPAASQNTFSNSNQVEQELQDVSMTTADGEDEEKNTQKNHGGESSPPRTRHDKRSGERGSSRSRSPERRSSKDKKDMDREKERDRERERSRKGIVTRRRGNDDGASDGDDEAENELLSVPQYGAPSHFSFHMPATPQSQHVDMPSVLSRYVSASFYLCIVLAALYLFVKLVWAVQRDVDDKIDSYSSEILHEIKLCSKLYLVNKCNPETRVPALTATCEQWERCMNRDPKVVGRGRVFIETIAEMYNTFFEGIGYKAFGFSIIGGAVFLWSANAGFSFFRSRQSHPTQMMSTPSYPDMTHPHLLHAMPMPTPGRAQSPMVAMLQAPGQWREGSPAGGVEWRVPTGDGRFLPQTTTRRR